MPIQSKGASGVKGHVLLNEQFVAGLTDLDGFSHIILIYHFHQSEGYNLKVIPFLDKVKRGLFSTRGPKRPNAIGLSVVKLLGIEHNRLDIENVDMLDETPLLDIKPYASQFDCYETQKNGWLDEVVKNVSEVKSDNRFN